MSLFEPFGSPIGNQLSSLIMKLSTVEKQQENSQSIDEILILQERKDKIYAEWKEQNADLLEKVYNIAKMFYIGNTAIRSRGLVKGNMLTTSLEVLIKLSETKNPFHAPYFSYNHQPNFYVDGKPPVFSGAPPFLIIDIIDSFYNVYTKVSAQQVFQDDSCREIISGLGRIILRPYLSGLESSGQYNDRANKDSDSLSYITDTKIIFSLLDGLEGKAPVTFTCRYDDTEKKRSEPKINWENNSIAFNSRLSYKSTKYLFPMNFVYGTEPYNDWSHSIPKGLREAFNIESTQQTQCQESSGSNDNYSCQR